MNTSATKKLATLALTTAMVAVGSAVTTTSADARSAAAYRVGLKVSATQVVAGEDEVVLKGRVTPTPSAGTKVTVQLKYEGQEKWRTIGAAKVNKHTGKYSFTDEPTTGLERSYRVVKAKDGRATKGISKERAVEVSAWQWLDQRGTSAGENILSAYEMPINGENYRHTLYLDRTKDSGFTEWTLGRKCTVLEATFGLSDQTETGGKATITVQNDGLVSYARTFNLGESELKSIPVGNVYRLRIDMDQDTTTPDTEPSAGAARVLCD